VTLLVDIVSWVLLGAGAFFTVAGAFGMLRMPDVYTRCHAAGVIDPFGVSLILIGLMVQSGFTLVTAKLVFLVVLLLFTSPVATHALARAALHRGVKPQLQEPDEYGDEEDGPSKR
jgi:multicomponent Na+:H+ antiporter subunit G